MDEDWALSQDLPKGDCTGRWVRAQIQYPVAQLWILALPTTSWANLDKLLNSWV